MKISTLSDLRLGQEGDRKISLIFHVQPSQTFYLMGFIIILFD